MGCIKRLFGNIFKLILILINIPLVLIGVAFIFFGSMTAFAFSTLVSWFTSLLQGDDNVSKAILDFLTYLDDYAVGVGVSMLVLGIIIFIVAFLGGFGACCNNYCMMVTYSVLMGLLAIGSLIAAIVFLVDSSILINPIADEFLKTIESSYDDPDNPARKGDATGIDPKMFTYASVFRLLDCCGVNNYTDFQRAPTWNRTYQYNTNTKVMAQVPVMCCKEKFVVGEANAVWPYSHPGKNGQLDTTCITNPTAENAYIETGCISALTGDLNSIFAWVVFGMAFAMLIIFFIAVAVTAVVKKKSRSGHEGYEMK